ncbi:asparaginase [Paenibacillus sinopodophylli]|uniref:asparaginase n=1 Tax=Paenibacillus sinopodophylli TaxID=1837342 RepID=UPI00110CEC94|nr:asparaginase [Paenibacillus sinopodophylli]
MTQIVKSELAKKVIVPLLVLSLLAAMVGVMAKNNYVRAEEVPGLPTFDIPALSSEHQASSLPNVIVVATGGTLAGKARNDDPTNFQNYAAGTFKMEDLVAQLPRKDKIADVSTFQFGNKGSGGYTIKELYDLSLAVDAALEIYDSAVVTTGTDTMEEIAYFLDLTVRSEKPVVVTGAMRPWDVIGTDGPANLYQAIKVAGSGKTKWFGTVVMLNDVIYAAREVTKTNSHRNDTFDAPMFGALGYVDDPAVRIYRATARAAKAGTAEWASPFDLKTISKDSLPIVEIVYSYQEAGGGAIRGLVADGAKGIVTAGTGAGGISSQLGTARTAAIRDNGVVFVSTTRTGSGSIYDSGNGSVIGGDNLNAAHARMMLLLSLAFTNDVSKIRSWFTTFGTQDVEISVDENTVMKTTVEELIEEPIVEPDVTEPVVVEPTPTTEAPAATDAPTAEPTVEATPETAPVTP